MTGVQTCALPIYVTLAFAGDVHFARQLSARAKPGGLASVSTLLADADISMVNLETSIGTHGKPLAKLYTFQARPVVLDRLADAGVDIVTQANNHSVDYGRAGLRDAVAAKSMSRLHVVGLGATLQDAIAPYVTTVNGTTIAFFGISISRQSCCRACVTRTIRRSSGVCIRSN